MKTQTYKWTSVCFDDTSPLPVVWMHPRGQKAWMTNGVSLAFGSLSELKELLSTLHGAVTQIENKKAETKSKIKNYTSGILRGRKL